MGQYSKDILEDLSLLTGARVFDENTYGNLMAIRSSDLGKIFKLLILTNILTCC